MNDESNLPTGRLRRLAKLVGVGARTGASLVFSRDNTPAAEHAASVLGSLRGLAAKVGQMASYVDGFVPDEHRDVYERTLSGLQSSTMRSSAAAVRARVEDELGMPIDEAFAQWEAEPFASASIGQVHRARLHDGRAVAVKVQHPGIADAIESDLRNASLIEGLVGALGPKALNVHEVFAVVAARFREELDYELEAQRQQWFFDFHAGDPYIRIPAVIADRSTKRVLTSEFVHGIGLIEAAFADESQRRHWAEVMWRFVFRSNLVGGMFNADPHPGNYLFEGDRVVFLDFGCVQPIAEYHRRIAQTIHAAALRNDTEAFRERAKAMLGTQAGPYEDAVQQHLRRCFAPIFESPFKIDRAYVAEIVREIQAMKSHLFNRKSGVVAVPPDLVFVNRLQFGFYSVLARLDVTVDYAAVERQLLGQAEVPLR